jgi:hypothetical protein
MGPEVMSRYDFKRVCVDRKRIKPQCTLERESGGGDLNTRSEVVLVRSSWGYVAVHVTVMFSQEPGWLVFLYSCYV